MINQYLTREGKTEKKRKEKRDHFTYINLLQTVQFVRYCNISELLLENALLQIQMYIKPNAFFAMQRAV